MFTSLGRVHQVLREELEPTDGCCTQKHLFAIHSQENNSSSLSLPHGCSGSEKVEIEPYVLVHHEREGLQPARREICKGILLNCRIPTPVIAIEELPQKMLTYDSTVVLQPSENCIRDDLALEALIISTAAYAGRGIGASELRANNAAKVYLSICLGLQAAGVLSIQRVPALWIDIGDQAYKAKTDEPTSNEDQSITSSCDQEHGGLAERKFLTTGSAERKECNDFSVAPSLGEDPYPQPLLVMERKAASSQHSQENNPICRVALRLYGLQQLEREVDKLSLHTNAAYYAVGQAYSDAIETIIDGLPETRAPASDI
ncbi:hypothetical protein P389DRAFT_201039 [Cystobasidium minutum MCA 4210]|uniref:uncharacterized protein n=1 Tax=Cystobasidium minutum MCA 4210 TaxID=1397322 RepID=UPI0034CF5D9E|eukprot:jgi/Rhomi1/201039/MIX1868_53_40